MKLFQTLVASATALKVFGITWNTGSNRLRRIPQHPWDSVFSALPEDTDIVALALQETTFNEKSWTNAVDGDPSEEDFAIVARAINEKLGRPAHFIQTMSQPWNSVDIVANRKMGKTAIALFWTGAAPQPAFQVASGQKNNAAWGESNNKGSATISLSTGGKTMCFTSIHQSFKGSPKDRVAALNKSINKAHAISPTQRCDEHWVLGDVNSRFHCVPADGVPANIPLLAGPTCGGKKKKSSASELDEEHAVCNYMSTPLNYGRLFCDAGAGDGAVTGCALFKNGDGAAGIDELQSVFAAYRDGRASIVCGKSKKAQLQVKAVDLPTSPVGTDGLDRYQELGAPAFAATYKRGLPVEHDEDDDDESADFLQLRSARATLGVRTGSDPMYVQGSASSFLIHAGEDGVVPANLDEWKHNPAYTDRILTMQNTQFKTELYDAVEGVGKWTKASEDGSGRESSSDHIPVVGVWAK